MMTIDLTQNKQAVVDDEDFSMAQAHNWYADKHKNGRWYAARNKKIDGKRSKIYMHRFILGIDAGNRDIDHKNRNGLDNRRENLRVCTRSQNNMNGVAATGKSSKYKGVYWSKAAKKWRAYIKIDGKQHSLGCYGDEVAAAGMYNMAAGLFFGEHARYNDLAKQFEELKNAVA